MIEYGEWLPDLPVYANPGATEAQNCVPHGMSYKPLSSVSVFSGATTGRVYGATRAIAQGGDTHVFAGTGTTLEKLTADTTFDDVSIAAGYTEAADPSWSFAQWGEQVLATNYSNDVQTFTLGTSTKFADLGGSPPKAKYITRVGDFVVLGNINDSADGIVPYRVHWSGIGNEATWAVSAVTQADYQDLDSEYGHIQGIVGLDYGIVFQEKAITRMSYVGSPGIFRFDKIETGRGCYIPGSIANVGHRIFYLSEDGFYMFDRTESVPIGANKVDKTFFADLGDTYRLRMSSAVDPINKLVFWAYPSASSTGNLDKLIIYNWESQKWSNADLTSGQLTHMVSTQTLGYTIDTLDQVGTNIDNFTVSLDSRTWTGGAQVLSAFDASNQLNYFTGTAMAAVLETKEFDIQGKRSQINRIRPFIDGGTITAQMGTRESGGTISWSSAISPETDGSIPTRSNARFHRIRLNVSGGFTDAQGVDIEEQLQTGSR